MGQIYLLTFPNGKGYVGQTRKTLDARFRGHRNAARRGVGTLLYNAWRKHGEPRMMDLGFVPDQILNITECALILVCATKYPHGYNTTAGGDINPSSDPLVKAKISAAKKGKTPSSAIRFAVAANRGRKQSPAHIEKCAATRRGRKRGPMSIAQKQLLRAANTGKKYGPMSEDAKAKKSKAMRGRKPSLACMAAARLAQVGRKQTQATKDKRAASRRANSHARD